jgi:CrcB protein
VSQVIAIAGGGAIGALLRFWLSSGVYQLLGRGFPWGTLFVNVLGSFLMGLLFVLFLERGLVSSEVRAAVLVGLLGSLTTFSTFSMETLTLIEQADYLKALLNLLSSLLICLLACWLGLFLGRQL